MVLDKKICGWCSIEKPLSGFLLRKKGDKISHRYECRDCNLKSRRDSYSRNSVGIQAKQAVYRENNRENKRAYDKKARIENIEKAILKGKEKYQKRSKIIKEKRKEYYYKNKEKVIASVNNYVQKNKDKVRKAQRENHKNRKANDISYSILKILRTRASSAIKLQGKKCYKTAQLVGCSMQLLLSHLESKFIDGMSWDNYGLKGWHMDHIIPCSSFDLSKPDEQKKCFHYTNLQPLWWYENLKKSNKLNYSSSSNEAI